MGPKGEDGKIGVQGPIGPRGSFYYNFNVFLGFKELQSRHVFSSKYKSLKLN